jgi:hypothetical protein
MCTVSNFKVNSNYSEIKEDQDEVSNSLNTSLIRNLKKSNQSEDYTNIPNNAEAVDIENTSKLEE